MGAVLKIIDKQPGQPARETFELHLASERMTARELIRRRIADEIRLINEWEHEAGPQSDRARTFLVQVQPDPVEQRLNPPRGRKELSEEAESAKANRAFKARSFVMLFDDRQVENLDEELTVSENSELVFLRLVPLVGG